jgi:hypothetical protein
MFMSLTVLKRLSGIVVGNEFCVGSRELLRVRSIFDSPQHRVGGSRVGLSLRFHNSKIAAG